MSHSITARIILAALISLLVTMSVVFLFLFDVQKDRELVAAEQEILSVSNMTVEALKVVMNLGESDFEDIRSVAQASGELLDMRTYRVLNGSDTDMDAVAEEAARTKETQVSFETVEGVRAVRAVAPVVADSRCLDCHDVAEGQLMALVGLSNSLDESYAAVTWFRSSATVGAAVIIGLTLLLLFLILRRSVTRQIVDLEEFSQFLALGDVSHECDVRSRTEIGRMADSLRSIHGMMVVKSEEAAAIARGDLTREIQVLSEEDQLGTAMVEMKATLAAMREDLQEVIEQQKQGHMSTRCPTDRFQGAYHELMIGVNDLITVIADPISDVVEIVASYSERDFSRTMRELPGEQLRLTRAMRSIQQNLQAMIEEGRIFHRMTEEGNLDYRTDSTRFEGGYREIVEGFNAVLANIQQPVNETVAVLERVANGDLSARIDRQMNGDYARLKLSLHASLDSLEELLRDIRFAADRVRDESRQVSDASNTLSQGTTEQAASLEETASVMSELDSQTNGTSQAAGEVSKLSLTAGETAREGGQRMEAMLTAMEDISEKSGEIQRIMRVIDEIAFQTNLLALNAAVEAARAGVHGKGFAVVAEEVRGLAQRSARAASETGEMIEANMKSVKTGSEVAAQTAATLEQIIQSTGEVVSRIGDVSNASDEQSSSVSEISKALQQIDGVTQSNAAVAQETAASAAELQAQAEAVHQALTRFTLSGTGGEEQSEASDLPRLIEA